MLPWQRGPRRLQITERKKASHSVSSEGYKKMTSTASYLNSKEKPNDSMETVTIFLKIMIRRV